MQSCRMNGNIVFLWRTQTLLPATVCGYVHTFHNCSPFQLKQWAKSGCIFIQIILWMAHFYCLFFQTSLDFSQVLLRNPAVAIDWMLSLKRRFASAYLVSFVLFGTSSSPTRQRQLSWEWRGPLGMPGLRLPGPLSQHVFVTGTPRKHKLTVIWNRLRETFEHGSPQVVEMSSIDSYYRYVRSLPYFQRVTCFIWSLH